MPDVSSAETVQDLERVLADAEGNAEAVSVTPDEAAGSTESTSTTETPAPDDVETRLAALEKENRALQSAKDKETAAERTQRLRLERQVEELQAQLESTQREHVGLREKSIDRMNELELREYIRTHFSQTEQERARADKGRQVFTQADRAVAELKVSDAEWSEYFDPRLASEAVWLRNPEGAAALLRENIAAVQAARKAEKRLRAELESTRQSKAADEEHEDRQALAAAGAFTADRAKGAAKTVRLQNPDDVWKLSDEEFDRLGPQLLEEIATIQSRRSRQGA